MSEGDTYQSFVSNPNTRTAHRGTREDGPECGQTMQSEPATVDAENPVGVVTRWGMVPCSKCFQRSLQLEWLYAIDHTATVMPYDREEIISGLPWDEPEEVTEA